ncbi:MAG: helix-turn-helix transcriptional regulator [Planctomycetaceae bacterium]
MNRPTRTKSIRVGNDYPGLPTADEVNRIEQEVLNDKGLQRHAWESKQSCDAAQVEFANVTAALKAAREAKGMSLADVEELTGIGKSSLSLLENGKGNPTLETLKRIADAIGAKLTVMVTA